MRHPRRKRRRAKIIIPVASMADIAFQLIIFFMICSNFARQAGIAVKAPAAPNLERLRESRTVVAIDAEGQVYVQGRRVPDARSAEAEVAELLRNARTTEARTVLFRCDRAVQRDVFEPVMDAITRGGGIIAAIGEREDGQRPANPTGNAKRGTRNAKQETPNGK